MIFDNMTVSILGCGWYGFELAKSLVKKGIMVKGSTTSPDKLSLLIQAEIEPFLIDLSPEKQIIDADFFACDVLWISIPPKARAGKGQEYLTKIQQLIHIIEANAIKQVVLISSTGVYPDLNGEVNEFTIPEPNTESGKILLEAENILKARGTFTTTIIRFAGLIGPGRDPGRFFSGKTNIPNGNAPVNLIHLTDCIGISEAILAQQAFSYIYNGCSPDHPSKSDFYTRAAITSNLEAPQFIEEKTSWKIVSSVNVEAVLGYKYKVDKLT
ncbi:MAG TPA: SDR family oxidoreductase [Mucilaginibacter sp.]|jgi:nucleoside-diphosphate-sugar epimerase|nr:SDR family oxidoreductase [Mucilaginibacter sp.]